MTGTLRLKDEDRYSEALLKLNFISTAVGSSDCISGKDLQGLAFIIDKIIEDLECEKVPV